MAFVLIAAVVGYGVGTLLAVVVDRLYTGAPLRGRITLCADGGVPPLLWTGTAGFVLARGRCPAGCRLPARLWYLPLLGAVLASIIALRAVDGRHAALVSLFSVVLLAFVATDFERHVLPNRLMYPALALAMALSWAWPGRSWVSSIEGGTLGLVVMFAWFVAVGKAGFGDVKLGALIGLVSGVSTALTALAVGVFAGGMGAAMMLASRRAGWKSVIAYGPYLALGAFVGMLSR